MDFDAIRRPFEPALRRLLHIYWRHSRGMTLGVRGLVIDAQNRVFLIKHSYVAGWHMPGGGVEPGEALGTALERELREEGNIELTGAAELFGIYWNRRAAARDHVALYVVRSFRQSTPPQPNSEIIAHGFFAWDALPDGTTASTRARVAEVRESRAPGPIW